MYKSLWPHRLQHARLPCPSPITRGYWNSCPLSRWFHPTLILCLPLLLPSIFPSIRVFSNESVLCIRWLNYWSLSFTINPFNEYSGLISFRVDWLYLLAVQGTLKSLLQHHSSKHYFNIQPSLCPTLTSIHDYWKNYSFDYKDLCQQSNVSAF